MVRLAGIEPTTPWFVAKYSIQLSYSREEANYSISFSGLPKNLCNWGSSPALARWLYGRRMCWSMHNGSPKPKATP